MLSLRNILSAALATTTAVVAIDTTAAANPDPIAPVRNNAVGRLWSRGEAEHVVLADCKNPAKDYVPASQMAYFAGPPNDSPDAIANVTYGEQQPWAGSGSIAAVFPDKVKFTVEIPAPVGEGQFAGVGDNTFVSFNCYARFKKALYTTKDGLVCDGVYDCDHTNPPGKVLVHGSSIGSQGRSVGCFLLIHSPSLQQRRDPPPHHSRKPHPSSQLLHPRQ